MRSSPAMMRPLPGAAAAAIIAGAFAALYLLERRRPLRRRTDDDTSRTATNLVAAAASAVAIRALEKPVVTPLARMVATRRLGLLQKLGLPPWAELTAGVVLLDYTLYLWHVLTHKMPMLWRFHVAHHADLDLDASTALRFHFAEMILSIPWRAAQVVVVGAGPRTLSIWQTSTLVAILFHHSNLELPAPVERWLCRLVTTPRMHGIHHSVVPEETDSNWSTIFSFPDYLHATIRLNVPQEEITIGVPSHRRPLRITTFLALPFRERPARSMTPPRRLAALGPAASLADAMPPADRVAHWRDVVS
ncbi:MAG TPA: sterol desaturase family protein [Candidatus Binatia bacterium]|nr:sterol desaturase family protein [Candidatus Binatia bacterium]